MEISNYELACIISYLAFCLEEFVYLPLLSSALFSVFIFHRNKKQKNDAIRMSNTKAASSRTQWSVYQLKNNILFPFRS